ncbi:MAG: hypothetical protein WB987_04665 [Candidatus Acidiferrales bacterium]
MVTLLVLHPALPIVAAIMICAAGFTALFTFAILYFELYRYTNRLAMRMAQSTSTREEFQPEAMRDRDGALRRGTGCFAREGEKFEDGRVPSGRVVEVIGSNSARGAAQEFLV